MTCEAMRGVGNEKVNSSLVWSLNKGPRKVSGPQNREIVAPLVFVFYLRTAESNSLLPLLENKETAGYLYGRLGAAICFNNQL